jgi:hypothetical protein
MNGHHLTPQIFGIWDERLDRELSFRLLAKMRLSVKTIKS